MLYGCEAWTHRTADDKRIEAAEMWFYRRLLRVTWTDKRTNESVLEELGATRNLLKTMNQRKLRYAGHALRNQKTDLMSTVLQGKLNAKRKSGRPPTSLMSNIKSLSGLKIQQVSHRCQDREGWRRTVSSSAAANTGNGDADR